MKVLFSFLVIVIVALGCQSEAKNDLNGKWNWTCCNQKYSGVINLSQSNDTLAGTFVSLPEKHTSEIVGYYRNDSIYFKRLHQNYHLVRVSKDSLVGYLQAGSSKQQVVVSR